MLTRIPARQVVNKELLEMHQTQLMQKESTGLCALLQDDKKEGPRTILTACPARAFARSEPPAHTELKRLYKLYSHLPTGLLPADDTKYGMTAVICRALARFRQSM